MDVLTPAEIAGRVVQGVLLGAGLCVGWIWLISAAGSGLLFSYQAF